MKRIALAIVRRALGRGGKSDRKDGGARTLSVRLGERLARVIHPTNASGNNMSVR